MSALARIGGIEIRQQQLAVPENHGQQVVEVVRDAAGQPSDGFHLLRLLILLLQRAAFGDVLEIPTPRTGRRARRAGRGPRRSATAPCRRARAIGSARRNRRPTSWPCRPSRARTPDRRDGCARRTPSNVPPNVPGCRPYWASRIVGPSEHPGRVVHVPDPDVRVLQRKPHALFRQPQRLDRLIPLGDVGARTERADDVAGVVSQQRVAPLDQPFLARALVSTGFSTIDRSPPTRLLNFVPSASRDLAGRHVSIQSRPSSSLGRPAEERRSRCG